MTSRKKGDIEFNGRADWGGMNPVADRVDRDGILLPGKPKRWNTVSTSRNKICQVPHMRAQWKLG